jgi:hypothetical protein
MEGIGNIPEVIPEVIRGPPTLPDVSVIEIIDLHFPEEE